MLNFPSIKLDLDQARQLQVDTLGTILEIVQAHGNNVHAKIGFWDVYLLNDPLWIKHVFNDNWRNYSRETFQFANFSLVTGAGLLSTHGTKWQTDRRRMQPSFHRREIDLMAQKMIVAIEEMHAQWEKRLAGAGQSETLIDVDKEMLNLALNIVGRSLFSVDLNKEGEELAGEILAMMSFVVYRSQNLLAPPVSFPTPKNLRFRRRLNRLNQLIDDVIETRRTTVGEHGDLLDLLMAPD
ncbi:MAG: cytochrome P450, partial [Chloroflexota bacterium]